MTALSSASAPRPSVWQRRVLAPLRTQLTQGVTPDKIALTIAVGTACSLLPFLGCTLALTIGTGVLLRLNQPILIAVNYLLTAVQLGLILGYVRLGEILWRVPHVSLSLSQLTAAFRASPLGFLRQFAWTGVYAGTAWIISVPFIIGVLYYALRPVLRRFSGKVAASRLASKR